jgi:Contractile injection system tube protein
MSGSLHKLVIHCYKDKNFTEEIKDSMFTAPINPESFTKNVKVELETRSAHGSAGKDPKFKSAGTEELKLDFILDGTGTMEGYLGPKDKDGKDVSVHDALDKFLKCVNDYDGEIHRPRFLIIFWGSEIKFPCVLSNLDINHTLFDPKGFPIRVKISATFVGYITPASQFALNKISSPDLTHYKKVGAGERLDLLTYKIYNDSKYFLQVARVNKLSFLRNIRPGTNLAFPPFDKK